MLSATSTYASQTGIYSLIYNFSMLATVLTTSLEGVWVPWFMKRYKEEKKKEINTLAVDYRLHDPEINEGLIKHVEDRLGHDRRYGIDPSKIKADLGWYPETSFEVGIVKTIDWYLDNQKWMEHVTSGEYQKYYAEMYANRGRA